MSLVLVGSPACLLHDMDPEHPEQPARLHSINDQLLISGVELSLQFLDSQAATKEQLLLAHDKDFVEEVFNKSPSEGQQWLDDDTLMMPHSLTAALHAAGAGIEAVNKVLPREEECPEFMPVTTAFCAVRPPGHHAEHARSGGFCIFNNIAIAARYALEVRGLKRVAIVDFDVHHGNGTEDIFKDDDRVMFCSSFQHPFYPFSGTDTTKAHIINTPIPAGTKGSEYRELVHHWFAKLDEFKPELLFISAGFDAHAEDDLGHLRLQEADYEWISYELKAIADKHCEGRIVSMLEGGYALGALARSVLTHIKVLMA
ncbi:histone deacetylase family protein [Glaciecola sp. MH2013]|uniref:histone deacetylase family protein n=1 Tax=Glaciecola sp. MH2013 TaxID=2785524 RepID=UPI00189F60FA|nr:histone deacetylase family protein [Glaciecola sp. MH2013]MBF7071953.1 histone deacetylase family protein [Glaciecola sp. MH2013]